MEPTIVSLIRQQMPHLDAVSPRNALPDLGFDSFSFVQLVLAIENAVGIEFADEYLSYMRFDDVGELVAYVERCASARSRGAA